MTGAPAGSPAAGAGRWAGTAEAYAATFAHLCAGALPALVAAAEVVPGETALDVGCGTGAAALALRDAGARVVAADPDAAMVAHTAGHGLPVVRAGLPRLGIADGAVDLVAASFVVNHLDDPRRGMRELVRVARRRVVVTIWPAGDRMSSDLLAAAFDRVGVAIPAGEQLPPERDFPRSADGLAQIAGQAGLARVDSGEVAWTWSVTPADVWRGTEAGIGVRGRVFLQQPPAVRLALTEAFHDEAGPLTDADGLLRLRETAVLATGDVHRG